MASVTFRGTVEAKRMGFRRVADPEGITWALTDSEPVKVGETYDFEAESDDQFAHLASAPKGLKCATCGGTDIEETAGGSFDLIPSDADSVRGHLLGLLDEIECPTSAEKVRVLRIMRDAINGALDREVDRGVNMSE